MGLRGQVRRLKLQAEALAGGTQSPRAPNYLIRHVLDTIKWHKVGRSVYPATDTEINILGALVAANELPEKVGTYTFPSGATITFTDDGHSEGHGTYITGRVEVEDLPEGLREYVRRMDPARQPERERRLHELLEDDSGA